MCCMFAYATAFNGDISSWQKQNVTDMRSMFHNSTSFNGDISSWQMQNVTDMGCMFAYATSFNGDISSWQTLNVVDMRYIFNKSSLLSYFSLGKTMHSKKFYDVFKLERYGLVHPSLCEVIHNKSVLLVYLIKRNVLPIDVLKLIFSIFMEFLEHCAMSMIISSKF
jgi:surface protein